MINILKNPAYLLLVVIVFILLCSQTATATIIITPTYVEDFNRDDDLSAGGLAESVFVHTYGSSTRHSIREGAGFGIASLAGESVQGLFFSGLGTSTITFDLAPNEIITEAAIWAYGGLSDVSITWNGIYGSITDIPNGGNQATAWDVDLTTTELRDNFYAAPIFDSASRFVGPLTSIQLTGNDVIWDHLMITTEHIATPIPASAWLFCSGLLGLVGLARRKQA